MQYKITDNKDKDFVALCMKLDSSLDNNVHGKETADKYATLNKPDDILGALMVYDGMNPIGCAACKKYDSETVEIKRVFVDELYRKRGIARELMKRIAQFAKSKGYSKACLETGRHMKPAIGLYQSIGYSEIPNYGEYTNIPNSICFIKQL